MDHDLFFEIFTKSASHYNWEKQIEYARRCSHVTLEYKHAWINAIMFARNELGEAFLKACGKNHPLLPMLQSKGDWRTDDFISMVKVLSHLKNTDIEYAQLKAKLISGSRCKSEGRPFLEVLQMFFSVGFDGCLVKESKSSRSPDLEIINSDTGEKVFVEISKLEESRHREVITDNYRAFSQLLDWQGTYLPYSFAQFRPLNALEMQKCLETVANCKEKATLEEDIVYHQDDMIRLIISHISKYDELVEYIENNNLRKGSLGAPLNFDDTYRLSNNKVDKKAKQIPSNCPGLVFIPVNAIYFMVFDLQEAIESLALTMKKHRNVFGTVIYATLIDGAEGRFELKNDHFFCVKKPNKAVSNYLLFVRNSYFSLPISDQTIKKLYAAFEHIG